MWNGGHHSSDGIGRHHNRVSGVENNDIGLHPDAHAVNALASFQHGSNYNVYPPQFNIPGVFPSYGAAPQPHLYYHGHHRLPYSSHEDPSTRDYQQQARLPVEEVASDRYSNEDQILQRSYGASSYHHQLPPNESINMDDEDEEHESSEEDDNEEMKEENNSPPHQQSALRGKPEAMTKALADARSEEEMNEQENISERDEQNESHNNESDENGMDLPVYELKSKTKPSPKDKNKAKKKSKSGHSLSDSAGHKKSTSKYTGGSDKKKIKSKISNKLPTSINKHKEHVSNVDRNELLLSERAPRVTDAEYKNLEALMTQFCRVPLLAEFSRPVALLHPELGAGYQKIIRHPVDVGHVCRGIRRRQYKSTRDVRLDMWRVFANCVKFHSHPSNKEATPSFVSIALHLKDFFNHLWQEYMLPSDYSPSTSSDSDDDDYDTVRAVRQTAFHKRDEDRRKRLENSGVLVLSKPFTKKKASLLSDFIESGGCVDDLDTVPIFGMGDDERDLKIVVANLQSYQARLEEISQNQDVEYTLDNFYHHLRDCYTGEGVLEDSPIIKNRLRNRLDRFFWKHAVPLHEANSRGVTQSSIWGNIAATIWARESSKKPYWPALCLGILPPAEQREGWHDAVTERNEARLPEKLRAQLMTAKLRCEAAQKRQSLSYFLVEFLGTHEFIWVRETDIIENFDPKDDPNKNAKALSKKSRSGRANASSVTSSRVYQLALEECVWAYEEYESVLQDAFEFLTDNEGDDDEEVINYSYNLLSQSDDEADQADDHGYAYDEDEMSMSDVDEANWLITHNGTIDMTPTGRKNAKLRAQAMKKQASMKEKELTKKKPGKLKNNKDGDSREKKDGKEKENKKSDKNEIRVKSIKGKKIFKKRQEQRENERREKERKEERDKLERRKLKMQKDDIRLKEREEKKEQRDLEKRRKKRMREREKFMRCEERKGKRRRTGLNYDSDEDDRGLSRDKRARATAIVKAYLTRLAREEDSVSLALGGVMTMPAAMIDSTSLLGMALAFRAAAGELSMPDDGENHIAKYQPWTAIDTTTQKTSCERSENLKKQIELLEEDILRLRNDTQQRKKLVEEYEPKRLDELQEIEANDMAARQNHFKKRKKPAPRAMYGGEESSDKDEYSTPRKGHSDQSDDDCAAERQTTDELSHASEDSWH